MVDQQHGRRRRDRVYRLDWIRRWSSIDLEPISPSTGALGDDPDQRRHGSTSVSSSRPPGLVSRTSGPAAVTAVEELTGESGTVYRVTVDAEDDAGSVSLQAETMGIYDVAGNQTLDNRRLGDGHDR